jgi:hypothetical protein
MLKEILAIRGYCDAVKAGTKVQTFLEQRVNSVQGTLKMEAARPLEALVPSYPTTLLYIPERIFTKQADLGRVNRIVSFDTTGTV